MSPQQRLRKLRNFADLIRYLEDELGWPLQQYGSPAQRSVQAGAQEANSYH